MDIMIYGHVVITIIINILEVVKDS